MCTSATSKWSDLVTLSVMLCNCYLCEGIIWLACFLYCFLIQKEIDRAFELQRWFKITICKFCIYHPFGMSAIRLLWWKFYYLKWHAQPVRIGVNGMKVNWLVPRESKPNTTALLTVTALFFPNSRRNWCNILTKSLLSFADKMNLMQALVQTVKMSLCEIL